LTSFAIERILACIGYLIDFVHGQRDPAAVEERSKARLKLFLLVLGAVLTFCAIRLTGIRILHVLQPDAAPATLDFWLTWLVVYAGADRVRQFFRSGGVEEAKPAAAKEEEVPIVRIQIDRDGTVRALSRLN
jgi:hypothetical protein